MCEEGLGRCDHKGADMGQFPPPSRATVNPSLFYIAGLTAYCGSIVHLAPKTPENGVRTGDIRPACPSKGRKRATSNRRDQERM
jgi:hypothetical protein